MMTVPVTGASVSKKGTVWLQVKVLEGQTPATGEVFKCEKTESSEESKTDKK